jgi:hypothetical protein
MSSIIEQAILDATQIREAALKTAENQIIEKYSVEIKEAMSSILEQEDGEEMAAAEVEDEVPEEVVAAPMADMKLCPCPDEEEETTITLDLEALKDLAGEAEEEGDMGEPADQDELVDALMEAYMGGDSMDEKGLTEVGCEEKDLEEMITMVDEEDEKVDELYALADDPKTGEPLEPSTEDESDEDTELTEAEIREMITDVLAEELTVDITDGDFTGWAGRPEIDRQRQEMIGLARLADTERQAELQDLQAGMEKLAGVNESLQAKNDVLAKTVEALKSKLDELTVANAKLALQNEVHMNESLNRRQKSQIVESIREATSVKDAKVIHEVLQSSAGASNSKSRESLNEAISRPSHTIPRREIKTNAVESDLRNRFQTLAGINKN